MNHVLFSTWITGEPMSHCRHGALACLDIHLLLFPLLLRPPPDITLIASHTSQASNTQQSAAQATAVCARRGNKAQCAACSSIPGSSHCSSVTESPRGRTIGITTALSRQAPAEEGELEGWCRSKPAPGYRCVVSLFLPGFLDAPAARTGLVGSSAQIRARNGDRRVAIQRRVAVETDRRCTAPII